jgi:hypothetical protein
LEFFQVQEENAQALEEAQQPSDQIVKEIWTIDFSRPGSSRVSAQEEEDLDHRILVQLSVSHWI